jgi:hypothetical protein
MIPTTTSNSTSVKAFELFGIGRLSTAIRALASALAVLMIPDEPVVVHALNVRVAGGVPAGGGSACRD